MLYNDECIKVMKTLKSKSIDMIFADPPYFLSNGGQSIKSGKVVSVNKGEWDKKENYEDVFFISLEVRKSNLMIEIYSIEEEICIIISNTIKTI